MNETEWLACTDPQQMLAFYKDRASERKLRLFALACYRRIWNWLEEQGRNAIETAERCGSGLTAVLKSSRLCLVEMSDNDLEDDIFYPRIIAIVYAAFTVKGTTAVSRTGRWKNVYQRERDAHCALLRDIFGNPLCPAKLDRSWLTPAVLGLASFIYEQRAFDRLPDLADALEDAECTNTDILSHCREPGPHYRGCWVVDLLLNKS